MDSGTLALGALATAAGLTILYVTLRSSDRADRSPNADRFTLSYGDGLKALVIVMGTLLPASMLYLYTQDRLEFSAALAVLVADFVFVAYCGPEFFRTRIEFDAKEVHAYSAWRKPRVIPWTVIMSRKYSTLRRWNVFDTFGYGSLRVSDFMDGRERFIERFNAYGQESINYQQQATTAV